VHIDHQNIKVHFCSTHLWHTHDIGKQRLFVEDRSMIAGRFLLCTYIFIETIIISSNNILYKKKFVLGVPVNRILDDVRSSDIERGIKRIHLLKNKIYTIIKVLMILHKNLRK